MKCTFFLFIFFPSFFVGSAQTSSITISSPDKKIVVSCNPAQAVYSIQYKGETVLADSKIGLLREDEDFSQKLKVIHVSSPVTVKDGYTILTAKKKNIAYTATRRVIETQTPS